jgi:tRNA(fMet)-specific endonuclease VapC
MLYMLDSDICIYIARRNNQKVMARFAKHRLGDLGISVVGYGELRVGAEKSNRQADGLRELDIFIQVVRVLPIEPEVGEIYARTRAHLERSGQIIGANDLWIAAHCLQLGLTLVTNNEREFRRIPNLAIENWTH